MISLALPVIASYLGMMLMGIVDLICVGRLSATAIGAVGVGVSIFTWLMVFGFGMLAGLDYLVSYAQGAKKPEDGHRALVQGIYVSTLFSLPITALLFVVADHLGDFGVNPTVVPETQGYLKIVAVSLWPLLVFSACRQYLTAMGDATSGMVILLLANVLNGFANWALVFGYWGAPALGVNGSAYATLISRVVMMIAMGAYLVHWDGKHERLFSKVPFRIHGPMMRQFLKLGLPAGFQMLFEVGVFALSTTLAARLAAEALAAHQVVLNIASMSFMVPLGLSSAASVLVGQALGRGDRLEARRTGWLALKMGLSFMACSAMLYVAVPATLIGWFTPDPAVIAVALQIIVIAALFQLSDGAQAVLTGALRGLGETRASMIANLVGHWGVGLPTGLLLCFKLGYGLVGLWIGLSLGLTTVAASLLWVWTVKSAVR